MATGLPVVATRVDGAPEAIEEGITGLLSAPGEIEAMARSVVDLIRDPERRRAMGRAGLGRVREWDIDAMVRSQEALYERLLSTFAPKL
jgi:glycosyltransferase involved in cell wall biosynthesis